MRLGTATEYLLSNWFLGFLLGARPNIRGSPSISELRLPSWRNLSGGAHTAISWLAWATPARLMRAWSAVLWRPGEHQPDDAPRQSVSGDPARAAGRHLCAVVEAARRFETHRMIDKRTETQASLYILGVLPPGEAREFEAEMRADPKLRLLVKELRG